MRQDLAVTTDSLDQGNVESIALNALDRASNPRIRRNGSQVGDQFQVLRVTATTTAALTDGTSPRTAPAVASETLVDLYRGMGSWFRFCPYRIE
jgi:hypothetical protein